ncbi:LacI family DNA-binding transcriptional regulator (plasmid) [Paroceanicella profunda]|uniref:LacI family DNA-binding transcriptional regulator n=1 Tax=Paroceanicella profunda TaxID=2579971 RepID=A0A5B8G0J9_9RHOB|nr:LacI family DNA-binding transcriptional regulator [Paroceanicella profunda]QDL94245.1 LacI family DNA-binding transcriptional regulator [Paroceanicella profunda]
MTGPDPQPDDQPAPRRRRLRPDASAGPTLAEVAARAGVSEITVSRVMRGAGNVSAATEARVREAVRETGYVRNRLAGSLAGHRSNQIGVLLPSLGNIVFPDVLNGIEDSLEARGFHPVLGITHYQPEREEHLLASLLAWRPAGLIVTGTRHSAATRAMLGAGGVPVVEVMDVDTPPVDMAVGISHRAAGAAMARHLIGRGYRRFGYVGHDLGADERAAQRRDGFRHALATAGLPEAQECLSGTPSSVGAGRAALAQLLERARPEAVFFSNDDMATGGVFHCLAAGISLPGDLAIAGFNGLEIGQQLPQPLTTIGSRRRDIGRRAADMILARLAGETPDPVADVGFTLIPGATA